MSSARWPVRPPPLPRWWILVLAAFVLLARVVLIRQAFTYPAGSWLTDSSDYLVLADSIRLRGGFTTGAGDDYDRSFGYPLYLAAFLSLPSWGYEAALAVQHVLVLVTCAMLFHIGRSLFDQRVAWAAALWLGASPNSLFWAGTTMSETLAAFWLTLAFLLIVEGLRRRGFVWVLGGGVSLALATLTRPIAVFLVPLWAGLVALSGKRSSWQAIRLRFGLLLLAAALVPIGMWVGRNALVVGKAMISNSPGRTLHDFQLARVVARVYGITRDQATTLMAGTPDPTRFGWQVAREHPDALLLVNAMGVVRTILGTEIGSWLIVLGHVYPGSGMLDAASRGSAAAIIEAAQALVSQTAGWLSVALLAWGAAYTLGLAIRSVQGLLRMAGNWHNDRAVPVILALATAAYLILIPLANGDARFRVPAEPFLAFLAGTAAWKGTVVGSPRPVSGTAD